MFFFFFFPFLPCFLPIWTSFTNMTQPPGEFDPFLDVFDFEDLTGITLGE